GLGVVAVAYLRDGDVVHRHATRVVAVVRDILEAYHRLLTRVLADVDLFVKPAVLVRAGHLGALSSVAVAEVGAVGVGRARVLPFERVPGRTAIRRSLNVAVVKIALGIEPDIEIERGRSYSAQVELARHGTIREVAPVAPPDAFA